MKKMILSVFVVLSVATAVHAAPPVTDPLPVNLGNPGAYFDNRQANPTQFNPSGAFQALSSESMSGSYFQLFTFVKISGLLTDLSQVKSVEAKHLETDQSYTLDPIECENWMGAGWLWWTVLRPVEWMYAGTWEFTLKYSGTDGFNHNQVIRYAMDSANPPRFMDEITHLKIDKGLYGEFIVSWNAPGDPVMTYMKGPEPWQNQPPLPENMMQRFRYQALLFDAQGVCPVGSYNIATHSPVTQRVTVVIPGEYGGRKLRLMNMFFGGITPNRTTARSIMDLYLPVWSVLP